MPSLTIPLLSSSQEFDAEDDSWESHLNAEIIEEFEESELLKAKRAAKHAAKAPKVPPVPFTRELADAESDEVRRAAAAPPPRRHLMHRLQNLPRPSMTCLGSERDMTPALHTHTCSVSLISSSLTRSPFACLPGPASLAAGQAAPRRGCRCRRGIPR